MLGRHILPVGIHRARNDMHPLALNVAIVVDVAAVARLANLRCWAAEARVDACSPIGEPAADAPILSNARQRREVPIGGLADLIDVFVIEIVRRRMEGAILKVFPDPVALLSREIGDAILHHHRPRRIRD
eukprot:7391567-Prymnesium_polylepis.8